MNKLTPHNVSGFIAMLPDEQKEYDNFIDIIKNACVSSGLFNHIDLPCIGQRDYLLQGDDSNKEMYEVHKSGHDDLLLRFDQTQPLANYLATNLGRLKFPFRCWQYGKVWRAERAQAARFREFYQFDTDIICKDTEPKIQDVGDVIQIMSGILGKIGVKHTVHISNRKIWDVIVDETARAGAMALIDKKNKMDADKFEFALNELPCADQVREILASENLIDEILSELRGRGINNVKFDPTIVRGLSYYTGPIFEIMADGTTLSIGAGGQYGNFTNAFDVKGTVNGFGGSIGVSRLFSLIKSDAIKVQG